MQLIVVAFDTIGTLTKGYTCVCVYIFYSAVCNYLKRRRCGVMCVSVGIDGHYAGRVYKNRQPEQTSR